MAGVLSVADQVALSAMLGALLDEITTGHLAATGQTRARVEGAVTACEVMLGADAATMLDRLTDPSP